MEILLCSEQKMTPDCLHTVFPLTLPCTNEILAGVGQMYTADEHFAKDLDRFGAGTAAFLSAAIAVYTH